jgi:preprotein translocase subunit SecF
MFVVTYRKIFFTISAVLLLVSIVAMFIPGFQLGIDFTGGTITEVRYEERPELAQMRSVIDTLGLGQYVLQPSGDSNYIIRTRTLTEEEKERFLNTLSFGGTQQVELERYNSIGPVIGRELRTRALIAIGVVLVGIMFFVTFAFRKVSEPLPSWKYGLATLIALAHDVIIPTGIFLIFISVYGGEIDLLFVSAILAILGYSVHDTIVVFDRVREHLRANKENHSFEEFEVTVGKSVRETFTRSMNTSVTIFFVLIALYFLGGVSTKNFTLVLLLGIVVGTYSSIFLATPLLVTLERLQRKKI